MLQRRWSQIQDVGKFMRDLIASQIFNKGYWGVPKKSDQEFFNMMLNYKILLKLRSQNAGQFFFGRKKNVRCEISQSSSESWKKLEHGRWSVSSQCKQSYTPHEVRAIINTIIITTTAAIWSLHHHPVPLPPWRITATSTSPLLPGRNFLVTLTMVLH